MSSNPIHGRNIEFHVEGLDPTSSKGNLIYTELLEATRTLVDLAREDAEEIGLRYGVEIQVREVND